MMTPNITAHTSAKLSVEGICFCRLTYSPIHGCCVWVRYRREEEHNESDNQEADGSYIDWYPDPAQVESRRRKRLLAKLFGEQDADAQQVGSEQSGRADGQDNVESCR